MTVVKQVSPQLRVAVIGAGNVAGHLAEALARVGCLAGVWSRNGNHASSIAAPLNVPGGAMSDLPRDLDIYILSVKDDAIPTVSAVIGPVAGIVAHTSGTVSMDVLVRERRGVFYPLQTFSSNRQIDMSEVPFFIEGSDADVSETLMNLALCISSNVRYAGSDIRATLHLAAVFACNFTNHLWAMAEDILRREAGCSLDVFAPLLHETLAKAIECGAGISQTGPAARGDIHTIKKHLQRLDGLREKIYQIVSQDIMNNNQN